ncbi:hypothetical protein [Euzebya tangerina]|uniref:hypothetical protein n=1 Tax=Euzebya tangerina TaxID=591198 RepID=UPI000E31E8D1|nr:hypothetical protein [Euzebya tangerina]
MRGAILAILLLGLLAPAAWAQSPTEEVLSVEGAANPLDAPTVQPGMVVDTILESETLWYGIDAGNGQTVTATVTILGQPEAPESERTDLVIGLTDQQRQTLQEDTAPFDGRTDIEVVLADQAIPPIPGGLPLLSVQLTAGADPSGLAGRGFRLVLEVEVTGDAQPLPTVDAAPPPQQPSAEAGADPLFTAPPAPPDEPPDYVGDLFPFAAIALAVGAVAGFELSRRGL